MTADWISWDRRHVWHPYTQERSAPPPLPIVRAEGVWLETASGRRVLDGISSWWVNVHGHNHPRLNRALAEQSARLSQVVFAGLIHEPAARLARALVGRAPGRLRRVFYSDDGSTAVEVGLKMAWQWWRNRGEAGRTLFVALDNAYHGDTFGAMAAGGVRVFHDHFRELLFEVRHVQAPLCPRCPVEGRCNGCGAARRDEISDVLRSDGDRVAAVLVEPMVQAAGGMIVHPDSFLRHVREVTRLVGVPLIADEVFTGFGRTGRMFACEHGPIEPDILCLSKAITGGYLPLGATLCTDEIHDAFLGGGVARALLHGHSYTGNALACAVSLESLALFDEEDRLGRVRELEELFAERLGRLARLPGVSAVRCLGGIAAFEMEPEGGGGYLDTAGVRVREAMLERGVLLRPLGNVVYFLPPYVVTDDEAHRVFDLLEEVLRSR